MALPDAMGLSAGLIQAIAELKAISFAHAERMIALFAGLPIFVVEAYRELQDWTSPRLFVDKTPPYSSDIRIL